MTTKSQSAGTVGKYDEQFFDSHYTGSSRSAAKIVPVIVSLVEPRSVVDVGCGTGAWLAEFKQCGVEDTIGVDGHEAYSTLRIPSDSFRRIDLEGPIRLNRRFDLAISLEVAEHLSARRADSLVADLAALAPIVLFSAAVPGQSGHNHINEQWPSYWIERFRSEGYLPIDLRGRFWNDPEIEWWYRQNLLLYAREDRAPELMRAASYPLDIIHPGLLETARNAHAEIPTLGSLLRSLPSCIVRSFQSRVLGRRKW